MSSVRRGVTARPLPVDRSTRMPPASTVIATAVISAPSGLA